MIDIDKRTQHPPYREYTVWQHQSRVMKNNTSTYLQCLRPQHHYRSHLIMQPQLSVAALPQTYQCWHNATPLTRGKPAIYSTQKLYVLW